MLEHITARIPEGTAVRPAYFRIRRLVRGSVKATPEERERFNAALGS